MKQQQVQLWRLWRLIYPQPKSETSSFQKIGAVHLAPQVVDLVDLSCDDK